MKQLIGPASIAASLALLVGFASPASAHISVVPGVSSTGNTTDALTVGKNNTLNFRVGHGCSLEKNIRHPQTKKLVASAELDHFATQAFSVTVPVSALGETGTTMPRPAFVPGWKVTSNKNADGSVTVRWRAISDDFALPNGPAGDTEASMYFDFGLRVALTNALKGKKLEFPAQQKCLVDIPAAPGFAAKRVAVYETWDGSTSDTIRDNNARSTAPSITVNP